MKRMMVWLVLLGLCAAAGPMRAHDEARLAEIEERQSIIIEQIRVLNSQVGWLSEQMLEEKKYRAELFTRVVWLEAYLMSIDQKFEGAWAARYPEKVEELKAEGNWPVPRVPGYSLVELKDMQDLHRRVMATLTRRIADLNRRVMLLEGAIQ